MDPAFAFGSLSEALQDPQRSLKALHALGAWLQATCRDRDLDQAIDLLQANGHGFAEVSDAAAGWRIFRETLTGGMLDLQISWERDTGEVMLSTPDSEAAWEQRIAARRAAVPPEQQALEALRERFYALAQSFYGTPDNPLPGPGPERCLALVYALELEIQNGGFSQYFVNSGGAHAAETLTCLREIGAPGAAQLLKEAMEIIPPGRGGDLSEAGWCALEAGAAALTALDDAWYRLNEDLPVLAMHALHFR